MPEQFENQEAAKLEDDTVSDATAAEKRVDRVAEKAGRSPLRLCSNMTRSTLSFQNNRLT